MSDFRLPNASERTVVIGRTGSGKTYFMAWLLSHASLTERPWIIIDTKDDKYLSSLPRVEKIKFGELPRYPGLYIMRTKVSETGELDDYLKRILEKGNTGVFTDEGADIPQREPRYTGLKAIFAKGRSKRVPILFATQRPSHINKSVFSEGDYFASFHLHIEGDRKRALEFMPEQAGNRLDEFHCHWYDVKKDAYFIIGPVNNDDTMARLDERLRPRVHMV